MPRPERPVDPAHGPVAEFAAHLRTVRLAAGNPPYRVLSQRAHFSWVTLAEAARGQRLPSWQVTERYVTGCRDLAIAAAAASKSAPAEVFEDEDHFIRAWRDRWEAAQSRSRSSDPLNRQDGQSRGDLPARTPSVGSGSVLIVDDHELFSISLRMALREHGIDAQLGEPGSYESVLRKAGEIPPGLVILDLELGQAAEGHWLKGSELVGPLTDIGWKVLIVTGSASTEPAVAAAVAAGATGVVSKAFKFDELLNSILRVAKGEALISDQKRQQWIAQDRQYTDRQRELSERLVRLTPREREVLELVATGQRAAAIAERFVVSMVTVRTQIRSILTKLEVNSQLEAVALLRSSVESPRETLT